MKRFMSMVCVLAMLMAIAMPLQAQENKKLTEALSMVPKDAMGVVVVRDMSAVDKKINTWINEMAAVLPMMEAVSDMKVIKQFFEDGGGLDGVNMSGQMVMVFGKDFDPEQGAGKGLAFLVAMEDFSKFADNFGGEGDAFEFTPNNSAESSYARKLGNFALITKDEKNSKAFKPGNNAAQYFEGVGKLNAKLLTDSDGFAYANMDAIAKFAKPKIKEMKKDLEGLGDEMMMQSMADMEATMAKLMIKTLETFLDDAQSMIVAVTLKADGLHIDHGLQLKAGSKMAKAIEGAASKDYVAFSNLSAEDYIMAFDYDISGFESLGPWMKDFAETFVTAMEKLNEEVEEEEQKEMVKDTTKLMKSMMDAYMKTEGMSFVWHASSTPTPGNLLRMDTVVKSPDVKGLAKAYEEYFDFMKKMQEKGGPDGQPMPMKLEYNKGLMELDGIKIDQAHMSFDEMMLQMMGPMGMVFGNGYNVNMFAKDDMYVMSTNSQATELKKLMKGLKEGGLHKNTSIVEMRKQLPGNRFMEGYVNFGSILKMAKAMTEQFGMPMPINIPETVEPIAMSGSAKDGAVRFKVIVPLSTQKMLAEAGMTMWMMQMQMGGGGGPGWEEMPEEEDGF